jgi:hypothetical protein
MAMAKGRKRTGTFFFGDQEIPLANIEVSDKFLKLEPGAKPSPNHPGPTNGVLKLPSGETVGITIGTAVELTPLGAAYLIPGKTGQN